MRVPSLGCVLEGQDFVFAEKHHQSENDVDERQVWADPSGPLTVSFVTTAKAGFYRLRHGSEIAVNALSERHLAVSANDGVPKSTIDHFLADQVVPRLLAHAGSLIVHAAAVHRNGHAIAILGESGSGKSTLAASFEEDAWHLMGDDAQIISWSNDEACAQAVYRSLRLFPDSIRAIMPPNVLTEDVANYTTKRRVSDPATKSPKREPMPISAAFVLGKPRSDERVLVRRLSIAETCVAVLRNSFALDPANRDQARLRLERASKMARQVPTFLLSYPRDFYRLEAVRQTMSRCLEQTATTKIGTR